MADIKPEIAAKELGISKFTIYRLPKSTPGIYRYGKAVRVNIDELRAWARGQRCSGEATERK